MRWGVTSSSVAWRATIAPPAGRACMSLPRVSTRTAASSSDRTPATWAAAISPIEWPATTSGVIPQCSRVRNRATSSANSAGCVTAVRSSASASAPNTTSRNGRSNWARTSSNARANTGTESYSSRPMPSRWEPWPVNRNAVLPVVVVDSPRPRAARSRRTCSQSWATTAARCSWVVRASSEWPTSRRSSSGWASTWAASARAWPRRAAGVRPERTSGRGKSSVPVSSTATTGGCSMMTWALVPLMPNDETPARRGRSTDGHGRDSVVSSTAPAVQSTSEVGASTCRVFGTTPWRMASTTLMMPATPAAAWEWPMLDLMEPSSSGSERSWP